LGIDHDRGCIVLWNVLNISCLDDFEKKILLNEFEIFKNIRNDNISAIIDYWEKDSNFFIFITDHFSTGSLRQ
jgi:hypothetical protein